MLLGGAPSADSRLRYGWQHEKRQYRDKTEVLGMLEPKPAVQTQGHNQAEFSSVDTSLDKVGF